MDSWHFKARQLLSLFLSCRRNRQKQWSRFIRPNNEDICLSNSPAISSPLCTPRPSAEQNGSHKGKQLTPYAGKEREKGRKKKKHSHKFQFNHVHFASCWHQQCTSEMTSIVIGTPPLLVLTVFFLLFSPFNSPHISGGGEVLSPFPYSLALVYCPAPLPSSLHLVTPTDEAESQRTCLFINVADGSRQRRKERAVRREAESETRAGERKRAREKKEVSVKESNWSTSTLPVNWWTTRWSNAPGGRLVTSKESSILQPLPETEWKFHFLLIFTHSWLTRTQASRMLWCTRAKQSVRGCRCPA